MSDLLAKLNRARLTLLALFLVLIGLVLLFLAQHLQPGAEGAWLEVLPLSDIGTGLFSTGFLTILLDYVVGKINEQRQTEQLRAVLKEQAAVMRDAVIDGFAFNPEDLARVSTPETLDQIVQNSLAIRLKDKTFAQELYTDIRDQAIKSVERWHDAKIRIRLSTQRSAAQGGSAPDSPTGVAAGSDLSTDSSASPNFSRLIVTIRQEYTTIPATQTRRFASVSDINEYRELSDDGGSTFAWFTNPSSGVDAASTEAFELVQFSVDGVERPIRRATRKGGQLYSVSLSNHGDMEDKTKPVTIAFTYRLTPPAYNRWINLKVEQPTRGLDVELDYSDTDLAQVSMLDFIASSQKSIITKTPDSVPGRSVGLEFDGWLMPKSGVAFIWRTKADEGAGDQPLRSSANGQD